MVVKILSLILSLNVSLRKEGMTSVPELRAAVHNGIVRVKAGAGMGV